MESFTDEQLGRVPREVLWRAVDHVWRELAAGRMVNPPRTETVGRPGDPDFFRLEMPAELRGADGVIAAGRKVIEEAGAVDQTGSRRLGQRTAQLVIEDRVTGRTATFAADHLTNVRTGAAAAWAARYLAGEVARVAVVGTGRVAREMALAADALLRPRELVATSRTAANRASFAEALAPLVRASLTATADLDHALRGAQVVLAAVPAPAPLLTAERVAGAQVVVAVEGDPRVRLFDPALMAAGPVVVDEPTQARRSGSWPADDRVATALVAGRPATVADAAAGRLPRLRRPVLVLLTGLAALDLAVGLAAWRWLRDNG